MKDLRSSRTAWIQTGIAASMSLVLASFIVSCSSQEMVDENIEVADGQAPTASQDEVPAADPVPEAAVSKPRKTNLSRSKAAVTARSAEPTVPEIVPQQAIERQGALLNAYYFIRNEGSWVDLAQRIYRDPIRAEDLKAWNPGVKIVTGSPIFYKSPMRGSGDTSMKAFHEDFGVAAESYTVREGDTLKKIAEVRLGSAALAGAIQAANPKVTNFTQMTPGTVISVPPAEVDNAHILEKVAQNQLEEQRKARVETEVQKAPEAPPVAVAGTTENTDPAVAQRAPASEEGPAARLMIAMRGLPVPPQVLGGVMVLLLGGAFLLRRRAQ